jgi:hypothetical protein
MRDEKKAKTFFVQNLLLGVGFFLVFLSFNGTQSLETSVNGNIGTWSVAALYISFSVCALFFGSGIVGTIGPKWSIFAGLLIFRYRSSIRMCAFGRAHELIGQGAITYSLYIVSNLHAEAYTVIPAGVLLGLGASVMRKNRLRTLAERVFSFFSR